MDVPKTDTEEADEEFDESDIEFDYSEADDITEDNSLEEETEHDEKCQKQQKIEITNLPTELWNEITSFLSLYNILQLTAVCKSIYNILQTSQTLRNRLSQIYGKKVCDAASQRLATGEGFRELYIYQLRCLNYRHKRYIMPYMDALPSKSHLLVFGRELVWNHGNRIVSESSPLGIIHHQHNAQVYALITLNDPLVCCIGNQRIW